jgi:hypothetical protein
MKNIVKSAALAAMTTLFLSECSITYPGDKICLNNTLCLRAVMPVA